MEYEITKTEAHTNGIRVTVLEADGGVNQYNFGADWFPENKDGVPRWKLHLDTLYGEKDALINKAQDHCEKVAKKFIGKHDPGKK